MASVVHSRQHSGIVSVPHLHSPPRLCTQVTSHTAPATCRVAPGRLKALGGGKVCGMTLKYIGKLFLGCFQLVSNGTKASQACSYTFSLPVWENMMWWVCLEMGFYYVVQCPECQAQVTLPP